MISKAQQERCPYLLPALWEKICVGPERCLVKLTFDDGGKAEARFYDGWTPDTQYDLTQVVAVEIVAAL